MDVAGGEHAFQSLQPAVAVDLGVAANDRRARGDRRPERPRGAGRHVVAGRPPVRSVVLDQPGEARSGRVRAERQAEPRRVEVGVGVGQRRQQHPSRAVDGRQVRVVGHDAVGTDRRDAAGADEHVDGIATRHAWPRPHPLQQQVAQLRAPGTRRQASSRTCQHCRTARTTRTFSARASLGAIAATSADAGERARSRELAGLRCRPLDFTKVDERPITPSGDTPVAAGRLTHDR